MSQIDQAYAIVAAAPDGMTPEQLAPLMGLSVGRCRCIISKAADYGALERVRVPAPVARTDRRKWRTVYRKPVSP